MERSLGRSQNSVRPPFYPLSTSLPLRPTLDISLSRLCSFSFYSCSFLQAVPSTPSHDMISLLPDCLRCAVICALSSPSAQYPYVLSTLLRDTCKERAMSLEIASGLGSVRLRGALVALPASSSASFALDTVLPFPRPPKPSENEPVRSSIDPQPPLLLAVVPHPTADGCWSAAATSATRGRLARGLQPHRRQRPFPPGGRVRRCPGSQVQGEAKVDRQEAQGGEVVCLSSKGSRGWMACMRRRRS